tara:strand:- start:265 stop:525 length:261 start_codon:yes stop_codon:yes gene_type:complete
MPKIAWAKHLYNAYHSIKMGDDVYDSNGNLIGQNDGFRARPTDKSPGSVCLVRKGKFIWISGDVEKRENGWVVTDTCNVYNSNVTQ